jgi:hypothetical protein
MREDSILAQGFALTEKFKNRELLRALSASSLKVVFGTGEQLALNDEVHFQIKVRVHVPGPWYHANDWNYRD